MEISGAPDLEKLSRPWCNKLVCNITLNSANKFTHSHTHKGLVSIVRKEAMGLTMTLANYV